MNGLHSVDDSLEDVKQKTDEMLRVLSGRPNESEHAAKECVNQQAIILASGILPRRCGLARLLGVRSREPARALDVHSSPDRKEGSKRWQQNVMVSQDPKGDESLEYCAIVDKKVSQAILT